MPTRKWGSEKVVNTTLAGYQSNCQVASLAGGGFVVVWADGTSEDSDIRAQRFDATGARLGGEIVIFAATGLGQFDPSVTGLADGGFFVSWTTTRSGTPPDISGKVYDANGTWVRWQEPVEYFDAGNHDDFSSAVGRLGTGSVAVWNDNLDSVIKARAFTATGVATPTITVSAAAGNQSTPDVAGSPDGQAFVVVWQEFNPGTLDIRARIFDENGAQIAAEFVVNVTTSDAQLDASVEWLNKGQFVVVWSDQQPNIGDRDTSIKARLFTASGVAITGEFQVNSTTLNSQLRPEVAPLPDGGFVVVWEDRAAVEPDPAGSIRLQAFDAAGGKIGGEILVNTTTTGFQGSPTISALADGRVVVTWNDSSSGDSDVRMQIIDPRDGIVSGTGASDTLYGHDLVNDEISGFGGSDLLLGLKGDDALYGGDGHDSLRGGIGADNLEGGSGSDTADYSDSTASVDVNLATGAASGQFAVGDTFVGVENIGGSAFADVLTGNSAANNYLYGLAGNDLLSGGAGADWLYGHAGNDRYVVDNAGDTVIEVAGNGIDTVQSAVTFSLVASARVLGILENLTLTGAANVTGTGNNQANLIAGNTGSNRLNGGIGNDTLAGGLGVDTLTGGAGRDFFVFNAPLSAASRDIVTDFSAPLDTFRLENAVMTKLGPAGALNANAFFAGAAAHDPSDRIVYNRASGALIYDSNGNLAGGAIQIATLTTLKPVLTSADFVVI